MEYFYDEVVKCELTNGIYKLEGSSISKNKNISTILDKIGEKSARVIPINPGSTTQICNNNIFQITKLRSHSISKMRVKASSRIHQGWNQEVILQRHTRRNKGDITYVYFRLLRG